MLTQSGQEEHIIRKLCKVHSLSNMLQKVYFKCSNYQGFFSVLDQTGLKKTSLSHWFTLGRERVRMWRSMALCFGSPKRNHGGNADNFGLQKLVWKGLEIIRDSRMMHYYSRRTIMVLSTNRSGQRHSSGHQYVGKLPNVSKPYFLHLQNGRRGICFTSC